LFFGGDGKMKFNKTIMAVSVALALGLSSVVYAEEDVWTSPILLDSL